MKYAQIGTVSHSTMRAEDLLEAFADELEYLVRKNADVLSPEDREAYRKLLAEAKEADPEAAYDLVEELEGALQDFAAPYCYFGAHWGNGSDFGFWPDFEEIEHDLGDFVQKGSELPSLEDEETYNRDLKGVYFLMVNDHGNATLYHNANGVREWYEVWSCV